MRLLKLLLILFVCAAGPAVAAPEKYGHWTADCREDPMTKQRYACTFSSLQTDEQGFNFMQGVFGSKPTATRWATVSVQLGYATLYVTPPYGSSTGESGRLRYRVDDGPLKTIECGKSGCTIFSPEFGELVSQMSSGNVLTFDFVPDGTTPGGPGGAPFEFSLDGFAKAQALAREWKPKPGP